jgi:hypothetical protein
VFLFLDVRKNTKRATEKAMAVEFSKPVKIRMVEFWVMTKFDLVGGHKSFGRT